MTRELTINVITKIIRKLIMNSENFINVSEKFFFISGSYILQGVKKRIIFESDFGKIPIFVIF